jgi:MoaA/NifB/PqqE/SkfB family radical SAM enzyme
MREIKVLHLESTDVCQAECALCAREIDLNFQKDQQHHLDMPAILKVFDSEKIAALDKMFICGNYGDPAAGKYTQTIFYEFRRLNPNIVLGMNTNGGLQNANWWADLGKLFNRIQDYVVFSIDGLEDTNHIYRRNVSWSKLIENAKAYIAAGGSAHWDMLVYQHNEHQVDQCQQLAYDLGFTWFRAKVSKRKFTEELRPPTNWKFPNVHSTVINCKALNEKSIYIDAQGRISPCCWLGNTQKNFISDFKKIQDTWKSTEPHPICVRICGTKEGKSNFENQWQQQIQFKTQLKNHR